MIKPIIAAVAAFAVFAAAGTGVGILRAPKYAVADSTAIAADSSHTEPDTTSLELEQMSHDIADDTGVVPESAPAASAPVPAPIAAPSTTGLGAPDGAVAARARAGLQNAAGSTATSDSVALERTGKVAKLFQSMSPRDAAKVLEQMADQDVITILSALPERRAGEILALMSAERSAVLTRSMLSRGTGVSR